MKESANAHTMNEPAEKEPDVTMATSQTTPDPDSINQVKTFKIKKLVLHL